MLRKNLRQQLSDQQQRNGTTGITGCDAGVNQKRPVTSVARHYESLILTKSGF